MSNLTPGRVSPRRTVPAHIARPEYVDRPGPRSVRRTGGQGRRDHRADAHRWSYRCVKRLAEVARHIEPGVTTDELDRIGHEFLCDHGAYPSTLGYKGYPKSLCTSVNEVICHGIPDSTELRDGDIVNIDITAFIGGVHGDTDATYLVGDVDEESRLLVERTEAAMMRGIKAAAPGRPISVIGRVIEAYAKRFGYGVVRDFTGHGIGTAFHSGLVIPHFDEPAYDTLIEAGMTFTIEPMLTSGPSTTRCGTTAGRSSPTDRQRSAQFEHTILVTDSGSEILTLP